MISIWLLYIKEKIRKNVYRESQRTKRELCASAALIMQVYNEDNARIKEFRLFVCWLVDIMFAC